MKPSLRMRGLHAGRSDTAAGVAEARGTDLAPSAHSRTDRPFLARPAVSTSMGCLLAPTRPLIPVESKRVAERMIAPCRAFWPPDTRHIQKEALLKGFIAANVWLRPWSLLSPWKRILLLV